MYWIKKNEWSTIIDFRNDNPHFFSLHYNENHGNYLLTNLCWLGLRLSGSRDNIWQRGGRPL